MTITTDFELGLIKEAKFHYKSRNTVFVGCFFHWKQAIQRKLDQLHVNEDDKIKVMKKNSFDLLTIVQESEIETLIHYLKKKYEKNSKTSKQVWDEFWLYFTSNWMKRYEINTWNYSEVVVEIQNYTNNPCERYNEDINASIKQHPSIYQLIEVLKKHACDYVQMMGVIRRGDRTITRNLPKRNIPKEIKTYLNSKK